MAAPLSLSRESFMDQILANNVETFGNGNAISVNTRQASMDVVCDRDAYDV
jgi:hypothetical protein